jgi:hypothetical protein
VASFRRFLLRLVHFFRPGRAEPELERELAAHLGVLEDEYRRRGLTDAEACLAARRAFGGIERTKELHRDARSFRWLNDLRRDIRFAARGLMRAPGFAAVVIVTRALGIGANTALFGAMNGLLLRKLPVSDPDTLVRFRSAGPNQMRTDTLVYGFTAPDARGRPVDPTFSYPMFQQLVEDNRTMSDVFACAPIGNVNVVVNSQAEIASAFLASGNYYRAWCHCSSGPHDHAGRRPRDGRACGCAQPQVLEVALRRQSGRSRLARARQ